MLRIFAQSKLLYDENFINFVTLEHDVFLIRDGIFGDDRLPELRDELIETFDQMEREAGLARVFEIENRWFRLGDPCGYPEERRVRLKISGFTPADYN